MPCALLSVYDKTGITDFAKGLHALGWTLLASGSTAQHLRAASLPVTEVADYTKSPEMLGGRVKTLHPAIHGGILARDTKSDQQELRDFGWDYIDLVAVNLYPFEQTIAKPDATWDDAIEQIDIGGVALIRATAKNHQRTILVCDPNDYSEVLRQLQTGNSTPELRRRLAVKGFVTTSHYDAAITAFLSATTPQQLTLYPVQTLRYGENPHQKATLYSYEPNTGPLGGQLLQGKELSYNNLLDLDAAWKTVVSFERPTICIVKHVSPCGIASADTIAAAFPLAFAADPVSAFGSVIASNRPFDAASTQALGKLFVECIVAPGFTDEARTLLAERSNCRLLQIAISSKSLRVPPQVSPVSLLERTEDLNLTLEPNYEWRSINRGILRQDLDLGDPHDTHWKIASKREPTEAEWTALRFAWRACQQMKSNAIVLAKGEATIGIGSGQPNRIDCVHTAIKRAGDNAKGSAMASDAFFPFSDCVDTAAQAGISAVIHPGGSVRDSESIAAADAANMAMVITGTRHFRH